MPEPASRDSSRDSDRDDRLARAATAVDDPLIGTEVGRYRLTSLLGEGGMGRVYLAVQPAIGSRVAVKILLADSARNPELMERFFAEARAVNLVHHEHIVNIIDLAQLPDGRPFIVMEYIAGETLSAIAADGPVALGGLVEVMREVLSAIDAAHAIGIVHRDLKPDNIRITVEGHAKVLDFGVAKLAPALQRQVSPRTRTGALLGTPHYMAPEQISNTGVVDARTDIYAAGVVLYELATGRKPFDGETLFDLMRAHLEEPPRPPRGLRPGLPVALEQVILKALAKQPEDRYASAAEMSEALRLAASGLPADAWAPLSRGRGRTTPARSGPVTVPAKGSARGSSRDVAAPVTTGERAAVTTGNRGVPTAAMDSRTGLAPSHGRRAALLAGGGVVLAGAALGAFLGMRGSDAAPVAVAPVAVAPVAAAPVAAAPVAAAPAAAPSRPMISLQLVIAPSDAVVLLDGRPVTDRALSLAQDAAPHALHISAPGYTAVDQIVRFDQSQRVVVQLVPVARAPRPTPARRERIEAKSPYD